MVVWAFFCIAFIWDWNENFTILDAIKNICDSWAEVNISSLTKVWEKLIQILMDDFEGFKTSVLEIIADTVEIARELELEVKPEDINKLLQQVLEDWRQFWKKFYCEVYVIKQYCSYREIVLKQRSELKQHTALFCYFKELPQPPQLSAATTLVSRQQSALKQEPRPAKIYDLLRVQNTAFFFLAIKQFKLKNMHGFLDIMLLHTIDYSIV